MFKVENICKKISGFIAKELNLDNEKQSVINYGIFAFIQMGICIALVIIFGFIFNVAVESLIVSFTISILRKNSGGSHAASPEKCAIIGTIISIGMGLIAKNIDISINVLIFIGIILFLWSYYTIHKLVPADTIAKPIKSIEKRKRLKKNSIIIVSVYLIIVMMSLLYFCIMKNSIVLIYSLCIYMGLSWQIFSITKYGYLVMEKLNEFL